MNEKFKKFLDKNYTNEYYDIIFCILKRYEIFMTDLQSMSLSATEDIYAKFDVDVECFANIFNRHADMYCSLFPDLEAPFGCIASFFELDNFLLDTIKKELKKKELLLSCNPPYDEAFIYQVILSIRDICYEDKDIRVIGVVPDWVSDERYGVYRFKNVVKEIEGYKERVVKMKYWDYYSDKPAMIGETKTILFEIN